MDLTTYYPNVIAQYPEYVTQKDMCRICGICQRTVRKLEQDGSLSFTVEGNGLIQAHKIKLSDVLHYLYEKECRQESDSRYIQSMRTFYETQFAAYPDIVSSKDVEVMTGFSQTGVSKWLMDGRLKSFLLKQNYKIPKEHLIDFLVSPYYRSIKNKSQKQKNDMVAFEVAYKEMRLGGGSL